MCFSSRKLLIKKNRWGLAQNKLAVEAMSGKQTKVQECHERSRIVILDFTTPLDEISYEEFKD